MRYFERIGDLLMTADILFIHPGNQKKTYQGLSNEYTAVAVPVWASLLAHAIRTHGYSVAIYDANLEGWDAVALSSALQSFSPRIVAIMVYGHHPSASTQTMPAARAITKACKSIAPDLPIVLGGTHPSALPERTLHDEPVDFVAQGEGLYTLLALLQWVKGERDLSKVPGLWYRKDDTICSNEQAPRVEDLDRELPGYAWDLLKPLSYYRAHNWHCFQDFRNSNQLDFSDVRSPYATIYTSLGCPYSCSYCCINAIFGKPSVRYWSIETVLGWIDQLVQDHGVRNIMIADELFILSPRRVEQFCDGILHRGYELNFWVYARVDTVHEKLLGKLKRAGVNWFCLGIESGNAAVRNDVNKSIRRSIVDVVRTLQAHDIYVMGNYMFGLPEDTQQTMEETLRLAKDLNCEFANFYSVMAYPGSRLYESLLQTPGALPETWEGYSQHGYESKPLATHQLTSAEVLRFRDQAFLSYFTDPLYLNFVEERFGSCVRKHLQKVTGIPLKRRLVDD